MLTNESCTAALTSNTADCYRLEADGANIGGDVSPDARHSVRHQARLQSPGDCLVSFPVIPQQQQEFKDGDFGITRYPGVEQS